MDLTLIAEVNRLQRSVTCRLNVWSYDQWSATIESLDPEDQSLWRMSKRVMIVSTPSPALVTPGNRSQTEMAEVLVNTMETVSAGGQPFGLI